MFGLRLKILPSKVNATALKPESFYILKLKADRFPQAQMHAIAKALDEAKIKCLIVAVNNINDCEFVTATPDAKKFLDKYIQEGIKEFFDVANKLYVCECGQPYVAGQGGTKCARCQETLPDTKKDGQ